MSRLDGEAVRRALSASTVSRLGTFEAFSEIDSTNSYLMQQPAPLPGRLRVAITDNQTRGRGRHGRTWVSPPGSGLCLSLAYAFAEQPANLPALTLAIGLGVIEALENTGVVGIQLKWPNDLIAGGGKLGGILTESQPRAGGAVTVVTGIGLNMDLGSDLDLDQPVADLVSHAPEMPPSEVLAAQLIDTLLEVFTTYGRNGLAPYLERWPRHDWLLGRALSIEVPGSGPSGIGAGVDVDGALLVETANGIVRVSSGSVVLMPGSGGQA
jgi:BirA family biotin operon repressor/biotin-[acetyl-CoA-carboxylase] ligase